MSNQQNRQPIPVYLFTGFLEAGKTKFIQETLEDKRFSNGEVTLVLMCEEGVEEYEPKRFPQKDIYIKSVENADDLTPEYLTKLEQELDFTRVLVEYNGMWMLDTLYKALPEHWQVYQEMLFIEEPTFMSYNANMRSLVVDKLTSCELAVFNRCPQGVDKLPLHKIVRATNRRCDIAYEYTDGNVEYDDIEDPLPFDVNAPVIDIGDDDFAVWYQDTTENLETYDGKTVRFKARVHKNKRIADMFVAGRQVMTCCIEDTRFAGFICETPKAGELEDGSWILLTAKIEVKYHKVYKRKGPVLTPLEMLPAQAPENEIATFY